MLPFDILLEQVIYGLVQGSIFALFAVGFSLVLGVMLIPFLAQGAFYMLAAYLFATSMDNWGLHPLLSVLLALAGTVGFGIVVERIVLRPLYKLPEFVLMFSVILLTVGLDIAMQKFAGIAWGHWPRYTSIPFLSDTPVFLGPVKVDLLRVLVVLVAFASIFGLYLFVQKTKVGRGLRAVVQDRETAHLMGINVDFLFTLCFAISIGLAAIAGILVGPIYSLEPEMGASVLGKAFVIVILAGFGNIRATLVAALFLGLWENLAVNYFPPAYIYASEFAVMALYFLVIGADLLPKMRRRLA